MLSAHLRQVIKYYQDTDWDHRRFWHSGLYQAAHLGMYNRETLKHDDAIINTNLVMADLASVAPGMHVLDAGSGWGGTSLWLAKHRNVKVTGINITPYQIRESKEKAKKIGLSHSCTFLEADFCDLPFSDDQFDVVWACESICHAPNKGLFYQEAHRVLKPGGQLIVADYHRTDRPFAKPDENLLDRWLSGWACADLATTSEHDLWAGKAGLTSVSQTDYTDAILPSLRHLYNHASKWYWVGKTAHFFRLIKPYRLRSARGMIAMYQSQQADLWRYIITLARKP